MEKLYKELRSLNKEIQNAKKEDNNNIILDNSEFDFLNSSNNIYYKLYQYVNTDEFKSFLISDLQIQMGLFAYVNPIHRRKVLRYLYGKQNYKTDSYRSQKPHFYLPNLYLNKDKKLKEKANYKDIMTFFYEIRNKEEEANNIDFVKIFNESKYNKKRTEFEKNLNIIYAPSGEMEFFSLALLLIAVGVKKIETKNKDNKYKLKWKKALSLEDGKYVKYPLENKTLTIDDWLKELSLVNKEGKLTERAIRMISWVQIYFNSIINKKDYFKIFQLTDNEKWLYNKSDKKEMEKFIKIKKINFSTNQINFIIKIIYKYYKDTEKKIAASDLNKRSRFNILSHFNLRHTRGNAYDTEPYSRAWVVYPVLYDNNNNENKAVGFFLGTFIDKINITGEEKGIFELLYDNNVNEIYNKIKKIFLKQQLFVETLAKVENSEIYFKGIVEEEYKNATLITVITQIFSRNYSHHIGSHVSENTYLDKINKRIDNLYNDNS